MIGRVARVSGACMLLLFGGCSGYFSRSIPATGGGEQEAARRIVLHVVDAEGKRIDWSAFRRLEENGPAGYRNDALLDSATLMLTRTGPLFSSNGMGDGDPSLTLPRGASSLSLAWPASDGYSNLIVALPANGGTYDFNKLSAAQVLDDIRVSLVQRPWYHPGTRFAGLHRMAKIDYARQRYARSLDAGVRAEMTLLAQAGVAYLRAHPSPKAWGATFDTIKGGVAGLKVDANLYPKDGWLRICFDPGVKPGYYAAEISHARALGLRVVGQITDSSEMRRISIGAFERRTREYVGALPDVDEWETGNEVNGNWLGSTPSVVAKTLFASKYVKEHSHARVLVTLYWELGTGRAANAIFNWAQTNMTSIAPYVDDIGISLYPRQNPMGEPFDRVVSALHAAFPQQRIMITELDYDAGRGWWWGSQDSIARGRVAVAAAYQSAIMGYAYSGGGTFWWYFVEEVMPDDALYRTLKGVYTKVHVGKAAALHRLP